MSKQLNKDLMGDRIKNNYENTYRFYLPQRLPVVIRLDGKAFHTLLKKIITIMFTINSYLQFRNTPDGKPRVLINEINYNLNYLKTLYLTDNKIFSGYYCKEQVYVKIKGEMVEVANLQDCRPLLVVEIDGVKWTEGDIIEKFYPDNWIINGEYVDSLEHHILIFDGNVWTMADYEYEDGKEDCGNDTRLPSHNLQYKPKLHEPKERFDNISSFFDDPAKYSKLLWNCSEKKGWDKIFKLLNIIK